MKLRHGDMFGTPCDVLIATGNATVRKDGHLVMGRGAALEMKTRWPKCAVNFGHLIDVHANADDYDPNIGYGLVVDPIHENPTLAIFQVKYYYRDKAKVTCIDNAVDILTYMAKNAWKDKAISLNYPGIGYGQLDESDVRPLLLRLPDNVTVWKFANT